MRRPRSAAAGYTLIETVIGLAIMGMILGFIFEGVFGAGQLAARMSVRAQALERNSAAQDWFRTSVSAHLPAQLRDPPALTGTATSLTLQTAYTLHAAPGVPRTVRWSLADLSGLTTLSYEADGASWPVAEERVANRAAFVYLDREGVWQNEWTDHSPPVLVALVGLWRNPVLSAPRSRAAAEQPEPPVIGGLIQ